MTVPQRILRAARLDKGIKLSANDVYLLSLVLESFQQKFLCDQAPAENQIVVVAGGIAQYRGGVFYTGMEDPRFTRPIQWKVTQWMPLPTEA